MGAEKIFQCESGSFLFVFWVLLLVLYGVSWAVGVCFAVRVNVVLREVSCC